MVLSHEKDEILPFGTTWMDLEDIMLSEISQTEKDKYCYQFYVDIYHFLYILLSFMLPLVDQTDGKDFVCNVRDLGSIPGSGRSPAEGNDNPLHYPCLNNPMDREVWRATVHGVAESQT